MAEERSIANTSVPRRHSEESRACLHVDRGIPRPTRLTVTPRLKHEPEAKPPVDDFGRVSRVAAIRRQRRAR